MLKVLAKLLQKQNGAIFKGHGVDILDASKDVLIVADFCRKFHTLPPCWLLTLATHCTYCVSRKNCYLLFKVTDQLCQWLNQANSNVRLPTVLQSLTNRPHQSMSTQLSTENTTTDIITVIILTLNSSSEVPKVIWRRLPRIHGGNRDSHLIHGPWFPKWLHPNQDLNLFRRVCPAKPH